mmetsp:Transcript_41672/g.88924  ORF Transcript_41672/g.88924 Transcript_41672/m.88924 type:complete len:129 (-) Transcript_41672:219-605(-)
MYSTGVMLRELLTGVPPDATYGQTLNNELWREPLRAGCHAIKLVAHCFHAGPRPDAGCTYKLRPQEALSLTAQDLIARLTSSDAEKRLSAKRCREHAWLAEQPGYAHDTRDTRDFPAPILAPSPGCCA